MDNHTDQIPDRRRVIIIDDNPDIHKDFTTILSQPEDLSAIEALEGELFGTEPATDRWKGPCYDLEFSSQGKQGAAKIKSASEKNNPFQLAFVDMRMPPGWDGLRTIEAIWKIDARIQIVLCTAYSDYSWQEMNQTLGATENLLILKKPFDSSEVAQMASTLTQKWHLARQAETTQEALERLVEERTRDLMETNAQLQREISNRQRL